MNPSLNSRALDSARPRPRALSRWLGLVGLLSVVSASGVAVAQQPGRQPPMMVSVDLKKVPVGSWSAYSMKIGEMPPMTSRMALVGKSPSTFTLEIMAEGAAMASMGGKMTIQQIVDADITKPKALKKVVMQMGDKDPMEMPVEMQSAQFQKPDPKALVGTETIQVPAGSFKTKHYRDKTPNGEVYDFWVSEEVYPVGLVKLQGEQKAGPGGGGAVKIELTGRGKDAKPTITKAAKPFDQAAFMGMMMGGAQGAGAAPAKSGAAPAKSGPAPAKPAPAGKK